MRRVALEEETVDKKVRDSLVTLIDSLYALGLKFDIKIDQNLPIENEELKKKLASLSQKLQEVQTKIQELPPPKEE